jgi:hypothetical protein
VDIEREGFHLAGHMVPRGPSVEPGLVLAAGAGMR